MKLHLAAEDVGLYLQEQSGRAQQRIPSAAKELVRIKASLGPCGNNLDARRLVPLGARVAFSCLRTFAALLSTHPQRVRVLPLASIPLGRRRMWVRCAKPPPARCNS